MIKNLIPITELRFWEITKEQALQFAKDKLGCDITDIPATIKRLEMLWDKFREETREWSIWWQEALENGEDEEEVEFCREAYNKHKKACDVVFCLKRIVEREE